MSIFELESLQDSDCPKTLLNGRWVPARPVNYQCRSIWEKLKEAWLVFRGKLDSVKWPEGQ